MVLTPPEVLKEALTYRRTERVCDAELTSAAVMVLLYPKDGDYYVLLSKRSEQVEHHKGEISFPGGMRDPEDRDSLETALRETEEEMGIHRSDITVLGEMDEVATRSQFRVRVYAGTIEYPYDFKPSADEIAEIVEFPVSALQDRSSYRAETHWLEAGPSTVYSYAHGKHLVFGATARILQQFIDLLGNGAVRSEALESEGTR